MDILRIEPATSGLCRPVCCTFTFLPPCRRIYDELPQKWIERPNVHGQYQQITSDCQQHPASQTVPCAVISRTLKGADLKTQLLSRTKYIKLSNRPLLYELGTVWNVDMLYLLPTLYQ